MNELLPLMIVLPLFAGFALPLLPRTANRIADALALLFSAALLVLAILLFAGAGSIHTLGGWQAPIGINLILDGASQLMILVIATIAFAVMIYNPVYMDRFTGKRKFYALFFLMVAGMNGVVLTGDLFNLFLFLEVASLSSYALVAFSCRRDALEAAFKYLMLGTLASYFLLMGIALLYAKLGTTNIAQLGDKIDLLGGLKVGGENGTPLFLLAAVLILAGLSVKAALVPFHAWLPDAHPSAPTPISAMLSGVLIKAVGIYALARVLFIVFGMQAGSPLAHVLMVLGTLSMVFGALLAVLQTDFKRLLAYSSISQVGYIALGLGLGTTLGLVAAFFHLVNHAVFKSLMFLNAGAVEYRTGTRELGELGGLNRRMPVTGTAAFVGSMSISGVPPFNGFFSKLLLIIACVSAGQYVFAGIAVVISFITLAYFMKVQKQAFFGPLKEKWAAIREVPALMAASMILLAVLCLATSALALNAPRKLFFERASESMLERREYAKPALAPAPNVKRAAVELEEGK